MGKAAACALAAVIALTAAGCGGQLASIAIEPASVRALETRITGATLAERAAVRAALLPLAGHSRISEVHFGYVRVGKGKRGRSLTMLSVPSEQVEATWQGELVAADIVRRLLRIDPDLARLKIVKRTYDALRWPAPLRRRPRAADALRQDMLQRTTAVGYEPRSVTAFDLPRTSAIAIVIRLTEEHLFDERSWTGTLFPWGSDDPYPYYLAVEAPDGTRIFAIYQVATTSTLTLAGQPGPGPASLDSDPPPFLDGRTSLDVVVQRGLTQTEERYRIDCQPEPRGVADAARACERLLRERWAFFFPNVSAEVGCSGGPAGSDYLTVSGTLGSRAVERSYGPCESWVMSRWLRLLGAAH